MIKKVTPLILIALLLAASWLIYKKLHPKELPPNLVAGVGHFDAHIINLSTKYPARVKEQLAKESKKVQKGEVLTILRSKEYEAKKAAIEQEILAKESELQLLEASLPQNVKKALASKQALQEKLSGLLQEIKALEAVVEQDRRDYFRTKKLFEQKLIQKHKLELAALKLKTDRKKLDALKAQKKAIIAQIEAARSTVEQAKASLKKIEMLTHSIDALKAQRKEVEAIIADLTLRSPIDGYVLERVANPGEVLGPGGISATLVAPQDIYLKIFVDTLQNGKIKLGDKAVIFLDAYPNKPFAAKVVRIAQKAEFTPKEVEVRSDRIQRVYAVHIKPIEPNPLFKIGLPAIGVISLDGKGLPNSLEQLPKL